MYAVDNFRNHRKNAKNRTRGIYDLLYQLILKEMEKNVVKAGVDHKKGLWYASTILDNGILDNALNTQQKL